MLSVVQLYPWFKLYFPTFRIYYHNKLPFLKTMENHNLYIVHVYVAVVGKSLGLTTYIILVIVHTNKLPLVLYRHLVIMERLLLCVSKKFFF